MKRMRFINPYDVVSPFGYPSPTYSIGALVITSKIYHPFLIIVLVNFARLFTHLFTVKRRWMCEAASFRGFCDLL